MRAPLALWGSFVLAFTTLSYTIRFTSGKPPKDLLYKWSTAVGSLVQYAVIAAIVYGISGIPGNRRQVLGLRRPTSWRTAFLVGLGIGLAYLRSRVDSVYPGMIVHGLFNAVALTFAVSGDPKGDILRACAGVWPVLSRF